MQVVYTGEEAPNTITKSLFLAGPSKRPDQEDKFESWRKDALEILERNGYDGVVFCPENRDFSFKNKDFNYDDQVSWEDKYLNITDFIVFWCPFDLSLDNNGNLKLPGFTTRVEFGTWAKSGKVVFGAPKNADKINYLKYYVEQYHIPTGNTLTETLDAALEMLGEGAERSDGECYVPLLVWNTPSFKSWYQSQKLAGNRLDHAELLWTFRPGYNKNVFLWILKVNIYIASEDRNKTNEFVLARTDISSVCMYYNSPDNESIFETEIVLVKEFRSPASTKDGFIRELPSGSSPNNEDIYDTAASEVFEETGFDFDPKRLKFCGARQLAGTFSSHKSHLFMLELSKEEMDWFKSQDGIVHGNIKDSERTFIEVYSVQKLIDNNIVDWSTLGQIMLILS